MRMPWPAARVASWCSCAAASASSSMVAADTLEQTSSRSVPSARMSSNLPCARRRLRASSSAGIASKSRNGWYISMRSPRSEARRRISAGEEAQLTRSFSKISTPSKPTWAAAASFSSSVPLSVTVAMDLRMLAPDPNQLGAEIGREDRWRDRAFAAPALLGLLPGVGKDADAPAQDEQPSDQRRREAELGVDDSGGAVDVHRHRRGAVVVERGLDSPSCAQVVAGDHPVADRVVHQREQGIPAGVDRMEAMPESWEVARAGAPSGQDVATAVSRSAPPACCSQISVSSCAHCCPAPPCTSPSRLTPVATALLRPMPQVAAMRAAAMEGACGPWSTAATSAASSKAA